MSERTARFRPTPGLKKCVKECLDKVVATKKRIKTGSYITNSSCCALGAVTICEDNDIKSAMPATAFALSLRHLGCTPWELESLEAGFEGWPVQEISCYIGANQSEQALNHGRWQADAYRLGQWVYETYVTDEDKAFAVRGAASMETGICTVVDAAGKPRQYPEGWSDLRCYQQECDG